MPRLFALLVALAVVAAACGGAPDAGGTATTEAAPSPTAADSAPADGSGSSSEPTPSSEGATGSTDAVGPPVSGVDGPPAPSAAVPFEGGNDIELSQEVLPVYLVFWAEW